jgi:hypothetical protein
MSANLANNSDVEAGPSGELADHVFDLTGWTLRPRPFGHALVENFVRPDLYARLVEGYPHCPPRIGPSGHCSYWGDPDYDDLVTNNPDWRDLFEATQSQGFVTRMIERFGDELTARGCTIDLERAEFVRYRESREDKERRHIENVMLEPHQLWVRLDIHQGNLGYHRVRHLDHRRRLISMLIYMCDGDENDMVGGDLVLHRGRRPLLPWGDVTVRPRHNRMAAFACHPNSWHSVSEITSLKAPRNFLQIVVSSSVDAWPT